MNSANLVKGGVVVLILLLSLAVFDSYGNYATSQITGAAVGTSCPDSITVSTGFKDYKQGETITFVVKALDAKGNILKTGTSVVFDLTGGVYGDDKVVTGRSVTLYPDSASGEMRYKYYVPPFSNAKMWIRALASSNEGPKCGVVSDKNFYVYASKTEPDLAVEVSWRPSVTGGEPNSGRIGTGNFNFVITNRGTDVTSPFNIVVKIKEESKGYTTVLASKKIDSLKAGKEIRDFVGIRAKDFPCETISLEVVADPDNAVTAETNKENNVGRLSLATECTSPSSGGASGGSGTGTGAAAGGTGQQAAQPAQQAANYKKTLYTGWNIVGLDALSNVVSSTCGYPPQIWKNIYEFNPETQDYDPPRTLEIGLNGEIKLTGDVDQTRVAWVYKYEQPAESCEIQSYIASMASTGSAAQATPSPRQARLDGWTLVVVPQDWVGKTPSQAFTNSCDFSKAYYFDTGIQDYREWFVSSTNTFLSEDVGKAFWLWAVSCYS